MKVSALALTTLFASALISTASAHDQCTSRACQENFRTGTVFEIAQQYSKGGKFGGISPGTIGSVLGIARSSMDLMGAPELFASVWRIPTLAKGE
jgi:hypothetical protein